MDREATPTLDPVEGIELKHYKDTLEKRFANPNIKDSVSRICSETSAKLPIFLIPTLLENLQKEGSIKYATLIIAAWCYYSDREKDENNLPLEIIDAAHEDLHKAAAQTDKDAISFIKQQELFGDLSNNSKFINAYKNAIDLIYGKTKIRDIMEGY